MIVTLQESSATHWQGVIGELEYRRKGEAFNRKPASSKLLMYSMENGFQQNGFSGKKKKKISEYVHENETNTTNTVEHMNMS